MSRIHRGWQLLRTLGPRWLMYRAFHAAWLKSGLVERQRPMSSWDRLSLGMFFSDRKLCDIERYAEFRRTSPARFVFGSGTDAHTRRPFLQWDDATRTPLDVVRELQDGKITFFSHEQVDVGFPPRWHEDPFRRTSLPNDRHWSRISDFGAGDIKLVWEINRFSFIFPLVRAYARTGDERYPELFWRLVEDWRDQNPPETGSNWKCGQEISLRVMAWCFGLSSFLKSPATTAARLSMLACMIAVSAHRVEYNLGYALSQQNNHGISEAMGLWTVGCLFPEFSSSRRWSNLGRSWLERLAQTLVYPDGSFSQHSMNYHRVMLHDYLWSMQLGKLAGRPFSNQANDRIAAAGELLFQLQDDSTGQLPCYGQNDGALILPLTNCDYRDFRPVIQSISLLTTGTLRYSAGPWDEEAYWICGDQFTAATRSTTGDQSSVQNPASKVPAPLGLLRFRANLPAAAKTPVVCQRHDVAAREGGYFTLRTSQGFAFVRAPQFKHRPAQADLLHVDLWWRGINVALDAGTYSYNAPPPWDNRLSGSACHNTVTVDGLDQMDRAGRFLWLPWARGVSFGHATKDQSQTTWWNGEHDGYRQLRDPVTHRRGILRVDDDHWLVVDALHANEAHQFRLHWLLPDFPYTTHINHHTLELQTTAGEYHVAMAASTESVLDVTRADPDSIRGWCSPYYHTREPALSVSLRATTSQIVFATMLGPKAGTPRIKTDQIHVDTSDQTMIAILDLSVRHGRPLLRSVAIAPPERLSAFETVEIRPVQFTPSELPQCTSC